MLNKGYYRIKQVIDAVFGRLSVEDWEWVQTCLNEREFKLFCSLDQVDQYHSVQVARTGVELALQLKQQLDIDLIIKAGLLHDLGKAKVKLNLFQRIVPVVLTTLLPRLSYRLGQTDNYHGWLRGFAIYWNHCKRGGELATCAQLENRIKSAITDHSKPLKQNDDILIKIIKSADALH